MFSRKYLTGSFLKDKQIKYLSSAAKSVFKTNILHKAPKSYTNFLFTGILLFRLILKQSKSSITHR